MDNEWIQQYIHHHEDFPQAGVTFRWYGDLLLDPDAMESVMAVFWERYEDHDVDAILGLESRGFIFGSILAYEMQVPFVPIRKCGKLPEPTFKAKFEREYGSACFEMEKEALENGDRVLIIDDLLATGGSMRAACQLAMEAGAEIIEAATLLEVSSLQGKDRLEVPFFSLFQV